MISSERNFHLHRERQHRLLAHNSAYPDIRRCHHDLAATYGKLSDFVLKRRQP